MRSFPPPRRETLSLFPSHPFAWLFPHLRFLRIFLHRLHSLHTISGAHAALLLSRSGSDATRWILALYRVRLGHGRQIVQVLSIFKKNPSCKNIPVARPRGNGGARNAGGTKRTERAGHKIRVHGCIYQVPRSDREPENTGDEEWERSGVWMAIGGSGTERECWSLSRSQVPASCFPEK